MTQGYTSSCSSNLPELSLAEMCGASNFLVFMSVLDKLIRSNDKISRACKQVKSIKTPDDEYDFVIAGGGGGGAVVAGRLSENPKWKVLLIEGGSEEPAGAQIPLFAGSLPGTTVDWNYTTTNESYACLSNNGSCPLASGKMLGGSTSHNGMAYLWGNPKDYDNWAAQGNVGWSWDDVKPFYMRMEDNGEIERVGRIHHSTGGPVSVQRFPYVPPIAHSILAAAQEVGYNISNDLNGDQITGFSIVQAALKDGVRQSSASAYLRPVRNRKNLHVSLNTVATRIIIENGRAVGVEYHKNGELKKVRAKREVVVSAGAVRSPHILFLSGVGPKEHLESFRIDVVNDLPGVGKNFHNQIAFDLQFRINETDTYDNDYQTAAWYVANQTGPLASDGLIQLKAALSTKASSPDSPNLQFYFTGYMAACAPGEKGALHSTEKRQVSMRVLNLNPQSRGRITLASNDSFKYPVIWGNYLGDHRDVEVILEGIKMALPLAKTKALRAHDFTLSSTPLKACSHHEFLSDEYWTCAMRHETTPEHHVAGSCKMGPSSDPLAVVDPELRVHGLKGLRVADASIIPQVTSSNIAASVLMIGERAAGFIKEYWASQSEG